jgi:hypothetical protein
MSVNQFHYDPKFDTTFAEDPLQTLLPILGGIFWTVVYLLIIGYTHLNREKLYMPITAFSMNLIWELVYSFIIPVPVHQELINRIWFVLDCIILILMWRNYFIMRQGKEPVLQTLLYLVANIFLGIYVNWMIVALVTPQHSAFYCAFLINATMSYLYILGGEHAPNVYIAVCKMFGTGITSIYAYLFLVSTPFMTTTYILIFILDCIFIAQCTVVLVKTKQVEAALQEKVDLIEA